MSLNSTTVAVANSFNLEDGAELAAVFVACLVFAHAYVLHRVLSVNVLRTNLSTARGLGLKMFIMTFPVTFATMLGLRSTTLSLNNACWELVPYSYLIRFIIHITLLCYQLRAFIVFRWFTYFGLHPKRRQRCLRWTFVCLMVPALTLVALMWGLKLGIPLHGVCTVGSADGSDHVLGVSIWVFLTQVYELLFIAANIATEAYLHKSCISYNSKQELRRSSRLSLVLLVWDALFRFKLVQKALAALLGSSSEPYKVVATTYSMTFACIYVVGTSCLFAWSFERARVHHFKLNPFTPRYWRLLLVVLKQHNVAITPALAATARPPRKRSSDEARVKVNPMHGGDATQEVQLADRQPEQGRQLAQQSSAAERSS